MLNQKNNVKVATRLIPVNYQNGLNIAGFHFKPRFIIEGIIIAIMCAAAFLLAFITVPFLNIGSKIGFTLAFSAIGFLFGCKGICDEPISEFAINYFKFKNKRRTAYYNPRVKLESVSFKEQLKNNDQNVLIEKLRAFFKDIRNKVEEKNQNKTEQYQHNNYFDAEKMFFADDEGIIEKPVDYMSDKEYERHMKDEQERQKKILRLAKQIEREERYKK